MTPTFNAGNAIKYIWRAGLKNMGDNNATQHASRLTDLKKALWYIQREIQRLEGKEK